MRKNDQPDDGYLSKKAVKVFIGGASNPLPNSTLYDWIKNKNFPKPFYITPRQPYWRIVDIKQWMDGEGWMIVGHREKA